ncbi:hypothetical protein DHD32_16385 [Arenibacter sp. TNZ]|uniref:response regulator n=1 Tax=Arenibacter TaxID=178469 RepID=UPI000CD43A6D|nr:MULTISPECIES: response regulator [Arenibacter]MCM4173062.1 hypothetical protein [Arenibacter sp. TNZ]
MFSIMLKTGKDFLDLIFLDLDMPGIDGWEFLNELKIGNPSIAKTEIYMLPAFSSS